MLNKRIRIFIFFFLLLLYGCNNKTHTGLVNNNNILNLNIGNLYDTIASVKAKVIKDKSCYFDSNFRSESPYPNGLIHKEEYKYTILNHSGLNIYIFSKKENNKFYIYQIHQYPQNAVF